VSSLETLRQSHQRHDTPRDVPLELPSRSAIEHGFAKLAKGPDAFATILHAIGVPARHVMAWSTILTELLGGLAVILGAFVLLDAIPMAALPLVASSPCICPTGSARSSDLTIAAGQGG
jgi:putative oxidoreductase